jgi:hypothetical protein
VDLRGVLACAPTQFPPPQCVASPVWLERLIWKVALPRPVRPHEPSSTKVARSRVLRGLGASSSRQALRAENMMLRDIITQAGIALEEDYVQMKLMDLENERLWKQAFEKEKQKNPHKLSSG